MNEDTFEADLKGLTDIVADCAEKVRRNIENATAQKVEVSISAKMGQLCLYHMMGTIMLSKYRTAISLNEYRDRSNFTDFKNLCARYSEFPSSIITKDIDHLLKSVQAIIEFLKREEKNDGSMAS